MRLATNFIDYPRYRVALFFLGVVTLYVSALGLIIYLWISSQELHTENQVLAIQHSEQMLKLELLTEKSGSLPDEKTLKLLQRDIETINSITERHRYDINAALIALERIIPAQVYLTHYSHDGETGEIIIKAITPDQTLLAAFLHSLEAEDEFDSALLSRLDSIRKEGHDHISFEIKLTQTL